jgi:putative alpha-1,2-mannosidase
VSHVRCATPAAAPNAAGTIVQMKVGLSFVSLANAQANLAAEIPRWDFEQTRAKAQQA